MRIHPMDPSDTVNRLNQTNQVVANLEAKVTVKQDAEGNVEVEVKPGVTVVERGGKRYQK